MPLPPAPMDDEWLPRGLDGSTVIDAVEVSVWRLPEPGDEGEAVRLEHVECLQVRQAVGPDPGTAAFRYVFDDFDPDPGRGRTWLDAVSPRGLDGAVRRGDRLAVRVRMIAPAPDGPRHRSIFDGNVLMIRPVIDGDSVEVHLMAVGRARKLWNEPIGGAVYRDGTDPTGPEKNVATRRVAHFNPGGRPNRVPSGADVGDDETDVYPPDGYDAYFAANEGGAKYPVFLDPALRWPDVSGAPDPRNPEYWSIDDAVRYLLSTGNAGEEYVKNPDGGDLSSLLCSYEVTEGFDEVDFTDPDSYVKRRILVPDKPVDGRDLETTLHDLIAAKGFNFVNELRDVDGEGAPETYLRFFGVQEANAVDLWLQPPGEALDLETTNVGAFDLGLDYTQAVNRWVVEGAPEQFQCSLVLGYGWPMHSADKASPEAFNLNDPSYTSANRDKYRLLLFGEGGDAPRYEPFDGAAEYDVPRIDGDPALDQVLGAPEGDVRAYAHRPRKVLPHLISADAAKRPLKYRLSFSTDYKGPVPGLWDPTATDGLPGTTAGGTWQAIVGGYELLPDRIGARITADNPNGWKCGRAAGSVAPVVLKMVDALAGPADAANPVPIFRLTCVIEGDRVVEGAADREDKAALAETITRKVDARDRYRKQVVKGGSELNLEADSVVRDDSAKAKAEAVSLRLGTAGGTTSGPIRIPRFTDKYRLGDRIAAVDGVDLSLRTDGGEDGDPRVLPSIVSRVWDFRDGQSTTLDLSDATAGRKGFRNAGKHPGGGGA